jgi:hypothetical protein
MRSRTRSRGGFAMPMTILVLVVLAVGLTGSLSFVTSERRVIDNITQQQNAFLIAQSGLDEFLWNRSGLGFTGVPAANETVTLNVRDGTAEIVLEQLRPQSGNDPALYVIRSTGVIPGPREQDPDARRTVAQLAQWQSGEMTAKAGWMSLTGLHKNGNSGTISGEDRCGGATDLPGITVPEDPGFSENGGFDPEGDPPLEEWSDIDELIEDLGIDWEGIVNQTALTPDVVLPGGAWPSFSDSEYWPIIHVTGDYSLPGTGRGILIVTGGSLSISGSKTWEGIVLVGEHLTSNGNGRVYGATYTGLDAILADDPQEWAETIGQNSVGNGEKRFQYDSCVISSVMEQFGGLSVIDNAWMDNWPAS